MGSNDYKKAIFLVYETHYSCRDRRQCEATLNSGEQFFGPSSHCGDLHYEMVYIHKA